jgi:hypothetical protein
MTPAKLKKLLEKFYDGQTSELEENELRKWLEQEDLPAKFVADRDYFRAMGLLKEETIDDSFERELFQRINSEKKVKVVRFWSLSVSGVAATIAIFLAIWFGTDLLNSKKAYGTITDPKIAFSESQKILEEVSKNLDKGLKPAKKTVDKVEENVKKTGEINKLNKALEKTKSIHEIDNAGKLLKSFSKVTVNYGKS